MSEAPEPTSALARLVLGTAGLAMPYGLPEPGQTTAKPPVRDAAIELIRAAFTEGVGAFDTAPAYGDAEARLGEALGDSGTIWTKLDHRLEPGPRLSRLAANSLEESLGRLRRQRVELLQWHNWTAALRDDPSFRACWSGLARDQRVSALGASTYGIEDALAAVESGLFRVVQVEWNLLNQRGVRAIAPARSPGVLIAARSVFLRGILTPKGDYLPDHLRALAEPRARAARMAAELGMTLQALALRAALDHPDIDFVLVGLDDLEQLHEAIRTAHGPALPARVRSRLGELEVPDPTVTDPRAWSLP